MLKSLVLPLEEEIALLKDKLRTTDAQLRASEAAQYRLIKKANLTEDEDDDEKVGR